MNGIVASRIRLFGISIDAVGMGQAVRTILAWAASPEQRCRYVVTPNVDHVVQLQRRADFRQAYAAASLVVADGAPLVLASRLLRRGLPQRVAGSDLVPALLAAACWQWGQAGDPTSHRPAENRRAGPLQVFLLGARSGVARRAAVNIERSWPAVRVVGSISPPRGFEQSPRTCQVILERIARSRPDLLLVGLGAPKQELWVHRYHRQLRAKVALCVGATIDFLAGHRRRSPLWMQRAGLEWLHRLASEPRRLAGRYARDAWVFPQLVGREWAQAASTTWRQRTADNAETDRAIL